MRDVHYIDRQAMWTLALLAAGMAFLAAPTARAAWSDGEPAVSIVLALLGVVSALIAVRAPICGLWIRGGRVQVRTLVQTREAPIGDVIDARVEGPGPGAVPVLTLRSGERLKLVAIGRRNLSRQQAVAGSSWNRLLADVNETIALHQRSVRPHT